MLRTVHSLFLVQVLLSEAFPKLISRIPTDASNESFCIKQATLMNADIVVVNSNGTCLMLASSSQSHRCCSFFRRVRGREQILLRTRVERHTNPYTFLVEGSANSTLFNYNKVLIASDPFKSPLFNVRPTPFSHLTVQLLEGKVGLETVQVKAELKFWLHHKDWISGGKWFAKERLEAASPWDISVMRKVSYRFFSLQGMQNTRRFYLSENNEGCDKTRGFMFVSDDQGKCEWERRDAKHPFGRYKWAKHGRTFGRWRSQSFDADELWLIGEFRRDLKGIWCREALI